ncbi:MAG: hypothetical protein JWO94_1153 [Verrucomicrobiaceae bacterium]|nr:hypothetical protein [Verrucomicrobiaceae bacterium]
MQGLVCFAPPMSALNLLPGPLKNLALKGIGMSRWTQAAWREQLQDAISGLHDDPGPQAAIDAGLAWLGTAQDHSGSQDGGVARHYSLITGWSTSYPETTGYTIPTWLEHGALRDDPALIARARRALDWLLSIQFPNGAFQGSTIGVTPVVPVTFDTGQILLGLAAAASTFGEPYLTAMGRTADWLTETQAADGSWRMENPYLSTQQNAPRTFETHVAWGLLEAARLRPDRPWGEAGLRNIRWAVAQQHANGWFPVCCLDDAQRPLTHTLAYAMRGVLEGYRFSGDPALLKSALLTATALASAMDDQGYLAGLYDDEWRPAATWSCLTGTVQCAICWLLLYEETKDIAFREAALKANRYVRRTLNMGARAETHGGVKGSYPAAGTYNPFLFLNWACKFMIDANTLELRLQKDGTRL